MMVILWIQKKFYISLAFYFHNVALNFLIFDTTIIDPQSNTYD